MKKFLILFSLVLLVGLSGCSFLGGELEDIDPSDITSEGDGMEDFDALGEDEVVNDRDLTADELNETFDANAPVPAVAAGGCGVLAGEWVLNTYISDMATPSGSLTTLHNNSGKTMTMNSDCTYVEDYTTEHFVPARMVQSFTDRGMDINAVSALLNGVAAEDIVCNYQGQNTGEFTVKPGSGYNSLSFMPDAVNQITGSCSPNVAGAMKVDGTHFTPGIGNTAVKQYSYILDDDKLTLKSHFEPQAGTTMDTTIVYTK
ncbi:MAG: hypothetical protein Q8P68_05910 [Candidatus Peregrinibacteria bacterium]|nr:hypothetical protein [Candidatus Peregrinibacteria bacterium]MDZ4244956.1 hypothetical protein [Candidatus Gracilibacteria bacterium]